MILLPESAQSKLPAEANGLVPILKRYGYVLLANQPMVTTPEGTTPHRHPPFSAIERLIWSDRSVWFNQTFNQKTSRPNRPIRPDYIGTIPFRA